jgi:hypothetical protein
MNKIKYFFIYFVLISFVNQILTAPYHAGEDSKVYYIDFEQGQLKDGKHSRSIDDSINFPEANGQNKQPLIDSYGNPINDPYADSSQEKVVPDSGKKSGIFVIPGYASGILDEPIQQKPVQRSQSGFPTDQLIIPDNQKLDLNQQTNVQIPQIDLLPPSTDFSGPINSNEDNQNFNVQTQFVPPSENLPSSIPFDGPVVITDVGDFAPKPADGLLPPRDDSELENVNTKASLPLPQSTVTTIPGKYSGGFGGSPGILGGTPVKKPVSSNIIPPTTQTFVSPIASNPIQPQAPSIDFLPPQESEERIDTIIPAEQPQKIPSHTLLAPLPEIPSFQPPAGPIAPAKDDGKYKGSFGGAPGVLNQQTQTKFNNAPAPVTTAVPLPPPPPPPAPVATRIPQNINNLNGKYDGGFGGPGGVLNPSGSAPVKIPSIVKTELVAPTENRFDGTRTVPTGFGGAPGILSPFDNKKS